MPHIPSANIIVEKRCTKCGVVKPLELFTKKERGKGGRASWCKVCAYSIHKNYRESEYGKARIQKLQQRPEAKARKNERRRERLDWEYNLLRTAKERAKKLGLEFNLTQQDIIIPKVCPLLNIPIVHGHGNRINSSPSLDRKDSKRGYTRDNVWVISWRANHLKGDATTEELELVLQTLLRQGL